MGFAPKKEFVVLKELKPSGWQPQKSQKCGTVNRIVLAHSSAGVQSWDFIFRVCRTGPPGIVVVRTPMYIYVSPEALTRWFGRLFM